MEDRSIEENPLRYKKLLPALALAALLQAASGLSFCQTTATPAQVPVVDGNSGPCSVEFRVTDNRGKPVYDARIAVRIAYGFTGMRKLDLEVGTNVDGKARFNGLPAKIKSGNLIFRATQGNLTGATYYDPTRTCTARQDIVITPPSE